MAQERGLPISPAPAKGPTLSVVVPLYNEAANVQPLTEWILDALADWKDPFEILLVDDGSRDETWDEIRRASRDPRIFGIRLRRNVGQTAAMMAGFDFARGNIVVSIDGDLQNDPRDIPALVRTLEQGYDLVCGWRQKRHDAVLLRKIPSWCANRLIRWLTGVPIRDNGCSLKAYRRDLIDRLSLYADQHRFISALAASCGARVTEIPVRHHARRHGKSKYGLSRTLKVLIDLLTLKLVTTFRMRPLLAFYLSASPALLLALVFIGAWLVAWTDFVEEKATALVFPGAALLWLEAALYLVMLGFIAEIALKTDPDSTRAAPFAHGLA